MGRPEAAVIVTAWGGGASALYEDTTLALIVMPNAGRDVVAHVIERGLAHAAESGIATLELEVDRADGVARDELLSHGFEIKEDGLVESWLAADDRPEVSPLHEDYRLTSRLETMTRPHHMIKRGGPDIERRLRQTSLYRADLDVAILDSEDDVAAMCLFWYDPVTATGLVEPMRTEDEYQRRGLARHMLTAGIDLLAKAGAERIKICFAPNNPGASHLYLSVGFKPVKHTDVFSGFAEFVALTRIVLEQ